MMKINISSLSSIKISSLRLGYGIIILKIKHNVRILHGILVRFK